MARKALSKHSLAILTLRAASTLALAFVFWVLLGYLATAPLGSFYGWSGHPSIPAAPVAVYIVVYLVALPAICLTGAWIVIAVIGRSLPLRKKGGSVR